MDETTGFGQPRRSNGHGDKRVDAHQGDKQDTADECFQARVHLVDIALQTREGKGDRMPRRAGLK